MRTLLIATIFLAAGCDSASRGCQQGVEDAQADMAGCPPGEPNNPAIVGDPGYPRDAYRNTVNHPRGRNGSFYNYHAQCYEGEVETLATACAQADAAR